MAEQAATWIAFEDDTPDEGRWIWLGNSIGALLEPMRFVGVAHPKWTHWQYAVPDGLPTGKQDGGIKVELVGAVAGINCVQSPYRRDDHHATVDVAMPTILRDPDHGEIASSVNVQFLVKGMDEINKWWRAVHVCSYTKVTIEIPEPEAVGRQQKGAR